MILMKFYTGYFGKLRSYDATNKCFIAITAFPPSWWSGENYYKLAPPTELLYYYKGHLRNKDIDIVKLREIYTEYYTSKVLNTLNVKNVIDELESIANLSNKNEIVLLCFEKSDDFCHRHLVSKWLNDNGIFCEELK